MVNRIPWPETLPLTPPIFLWVQLVNSCCLWAGSVSPPQRQPAPECRRRFWLLPWPLLTGLCMFQWAHFPSLLRKFDFIFFQEVLKVANASLYSSYGVCYLHTPICLFIYPTLHQPFPTSSFVYPLIPDTSLTLVCLSPMMVEGFFMFFESVSLYIFN